MPRRYAACCPFRGAVTFLNLSDELLPLSADDVQIVIRQLASFLFNHTLVLLPFPFDLVPVHGPSSIQGSTCFLSSPLPF
jgi:hypothetical protein